MMNEYEIAAFGERLREEFAPPLSTEFFHDLLKSIDVADGQPVEETK